MLNPQVAYQIDSRALLYSLVNGSQSDLREIRSEFARFLTSREASNATSWQDAWNRFTGARENLIGQIAYTPTRCQDCNGKGFNHRNISRNLSRTGSPHICGGCRGSRRGTRTTIRARFIPLPEPAQPTDPTQTGDSA